MNNKTFQQLLADDDSRRQEKKSRLNFSLGSKLIEAGLFKSKTKPLCSIKGTPGCMNNIESIGDDYCPWCIASRG